MKKIKLIPLRTKEEQKLIDDAFNKLYQSTYTYLEKVSIIPECCKNCHNHPSNGGSGICLCTAPYFSGDYGITCNTYNFRGVTFDEET